MPTQTAELFLLEDLRDAGRTSGLAEGELDGLRAIADWITTYVTKSHEELVGHAGPVCPFVPGSVERKTLWLAPERIGDRDEADVVELMRGYKRLLLERAAEGEEDVYDVIAVIFGDLPADRAQGIFGEVIEQLAVPSYVEDGILFGPYYEGNEATALYNPGFRPFESPVPFMFVRHGVVADWKFFLDDDEWLGLWAHRFGESATHALAEELRGLPWREPRSR
jgi:Domain of unknown function (DUF6875)